MRVKVRAVMVVDGRLVVSRERRRGVERLLLPGGRVKDGEPIATALEREVAEELDLRIVPRRLLYVAEVVSGHLLHDLNLIWLAELRDDHAEIDERLVISFDDAAAASVMPPIVAEVERDMKTGWSDTPRWLGDVRRSGR